MTDITTAREEIQAQRDALMVGRHVNRIPQEPGEGCLVRRRLGFNECEGIYTRVAIRAVAWSAASLGHRLLLADDACGYHLMQFNDGKGDYPGLTATQAIAILDEALLVLKDYEAGLA